MNTCWRKGVAAALLAVVLTGCAGAQVRTLDSDDTGLLFGFFDLSEYTSPLGQVFLTQDERSGIAYRQSAMVTYEDGLFFMENLPPMDYVVSHFTAGGQLFSLRPTDADRIPIQAGALLYLGAYKYEPLETGVFSQEEFDLRPLESPSEADLLKLLAERVAYPQWKARIETRLRELGEP